MILTRTVRLRSFGRHGLMFKIVIANFRLINITGVHEKAKNNMCGQTLCFHDRCDDSVGETTGTVHPL